MRCDEVADLIEPWAAGELTPSSDQAAHLRTCPSCARALALARRMEAMLVTTSWAPVPAGFTGNLLLRIRNESWRREQLLDRAFNIAMATAGVVVAAATWLALEWSGVNALMGRALAAAGEVLSTSVAHMPIEPVLYGAAVVSGVAALLVWRWNEGDPLY